MFLWTLISAHFLFKIVDGNHHGMYPVFCFPEGMKHKIQIVIQIFEIIKPTLYALFFSY